jgi:hypothetical protein
VVQTKDRKSLDMTDKVNFEYDINADFDNVLSG